MTTTLTKHLAAGAIATLLLAAGCAGSSTGAGSAASTGLDATFASATDAAGTLLCSPSQAQLAACAEKAAGVACTLLAKDGTTQIAGTCRATLDGKAVGCAPNPKGPPQELVDACTGKAAGATCQVTEKDEDETETHGGVCVTARDGSTLVCGRDHTPPQAAIDACATLAAGATCTMPDHDGDSAKTGVCAMGPASTGPLACVRAHDLRPSATAACKGLPAGAACAIGHHDEVSGSCMVPAAGGDAVCVPACRDLGGRFDCHD